LFAQVAERQYPKENSVLNVAISSRQIIARNVELPSPTAQNSALNVAKEYKE